MNLKQHITNITSDGKNPEALTAFAEVVNSTPAYIKKVAYGFNDAKPGESLCIRIERATGGLVTCEEMRPDVDWSFLRQA